MPPVPPYQYNVDAVNRSIVPSGRDKKQQEYASDLPGCGF
jgi:hypothetical protein